MDQMVELARFCEDLGFHGVSYGDHLVTTKDQVDEYLYKNSGTPLNRFTTKVRGFFTFLSNHTLVA